MMTDKHTAMLESGEDQFRYLLEQAGGTLSQDAVAARLGLTISDVQQLTEEHRLLAIELEGIKKYPVWQFTGAGVVTGLEQVLAQLSGLSAVLKVTFFLSRDERLDMERVECLRAKGADRELLHQASQVGRHGAA